MVSHEDKRKERIGILKRSIEEAGKNINREKLIAHACLEWGATRRTILEYLKIIEINLT